MNTIFSNYCRLDSIEELLTKPKGAQKFLHVDKHVPNLIALSPNEDLTRTAAYRDGRIILQDKASCFPAHLLGPPAEGRDCIDACAAPGNKTTHMAALMQTHMEKGKAHIYACERNKQRAKTLQAMIALAGADKHTNVKAGQDFLRLDPIHLTWSNVGSIILDPSCSGSGIVGRDEELTLTLPRVGDDNEPKAKKRKRKASDIQTMRTSTIRENQVLVEEPPKDPDFRLEALSHIQLKLLLHAFRFPHATRVAYSTCSIHVQENEHVVTKALLSPTAMERGWRILQRDEQVSGMAAWPVRGQESACEKASSTHPGCRDGVTAEEVAAACIRCERGSKEGTQGFFVAAFVRSEGAVCIPSKGTFPARPSLQSFGTQESKEDEWEGFSDEE